jgi:hypothetical protein
VVQAPPEKAYSSAPEATKPHLRKIAEKMALNTQGIPELAPAHEVLTTRTSMSKSPVIVALAHRFGAIWFPKKSR